MELIMTRLFSDISSAIFDQLVPNSSLARKHLMLIKKNVQGFSLIELMVAVGIMGGMTTLAVPQYGKYKVKAAYTEVKATLANAHAAQELHMVDKNYYADTFAAIGLDSLPKNKAAADKSGQNFKYASGPGPNLNNGKFALSNNGKDINASITEGVEYRLVARAVRKLASCTREAASDIWCLDNEKLITNTQTAANNSMLSDRSTAKCKGIPVNTSYKGDTGDDANQSLC